MARIEYHIGQPLGKNEVKHKFLRDIEPDNTGKRRATFQCGFCSDEFDAPIHTVKSGRRYSCGCMANSRPDAYKNGTRPDKYDTTAKLIALLERVKNHRKQGLSYESFAECDRLTLQSYYIKRPDIFTPEAIHEINAGCHMYYERIGIAGMLGRIGDTVQYKDKKGKMQTKFERRQFNSSVFTLLVKNMLGWKNEPDISVGNEDEGIGIIYELPDGTVLNPDGSIEHFNG